MRKEQFLAIIKAFGVVFGFGLLAILAGGLTNWFVYGSTKGPEIHYGVGIFSDFTSGDWVVFGLFAAFILYAIYRSFKK